MELRTEKRLQALLQRRSIELGKTLKTVAAEAGLARSYLYKLADGTTRDPSVQTLLRLAGAMQISPIALLRLYGDLNAPGGGKEHGRPSSSRAVGLSDARDIVMINPDVTIPHHAVVNGGEVFEKIWEVHNIGDAVWAGRRLVRIDGLSAGVAAKPAERSVKPYPQLVSLERQIAIPRTLPGDVLRFGTHFVAPRENCSVASIWRIEDRFNRPCYGPALILEVVVTVVDQ